MTLITTILSVFGSGLGSLFSWIIALFQKEAAEKQAASDQMNQDISQHAGDGALSVGDMDSAEWQLQNLKNKLDQIDSQTAIKPGGRT